jgi:hypothetical protein
MSRMGQEAAPRPDQRDYFLDFLRRKEKPRAVMHEDPNWPHTGSYAAHTTFIKELYGHEGLIYDIILFKITSSKAE